MGVLSGFCYVSSIFYIDLESSLNVTFIASNYVPSIFIIDSVNNYVRFCISVTASSVTVKSGKTVLIISISALISGATYFDNNTGKVTN